MGSPSAFFQEVISHQDYVAHAGIKASHDQVSAFHHPASNATCVRPSTVYPALANGEPGARASLLLHRQRAR
jgi:hypothetical protein